MNKFIASILILLLSQTIKAQEGTPIDSTRSLLTNKYIQIEATQAINDLYNFEFNRSYRHFLYLKKQYGWHPLPYFMIGLNYWWRILPNTDNTEFDEPFFAYMDSSIVLAENIREKYNKVEGAFFLAAAYAFKGRLYSDRGDYGKAAFAGKNSLKYLDECKGHEELSPELLFGDALFNYYAEWIPENYPILKPLMIMFPDGDKELGIQQLKTVARNAFYTRTEAQYYLMRISYFEEKDYEASLQLAEYLHQTFPKNAYFHRFYARLLYQTGKYDKATLESKSILNRIDSTWAGYEYNSGRYASFFLGHINEVRKNYEDSKKYFKLAMEFSEWGNATDMGYYIYSILHLGRIAEKEEDITNAIAYYEKVKKVTKRKHSANKEARKKLKELD